MANELKITAAVRAEKGNFRHEANPGTVQFDMATGSGGNPGIVAATTTSAAISFGAVSPGYVWLRNLSTASTVAINSTSGLQVGLFGPGKLAIWPKGSAGWALIATTAGGTANVDIRGYST